MVASKALRMRRAMYRATLCMVYCAIALLMPYAETQFSRVNIDIINIIVEAIFPNVDRRVRSPTVNMERSFVPIFGGSPCFRHFC